MGWRIVSTVSPKYILFLGNDALDGFNKRQVSLSLGQSSVGSGAVRIQATLAFHPFRCGSIRDPSLTVPGDALPTRRDCDDGADRPDTIGTHGAAANTWIKVINAPRTMVRRASNSERVLNKPAFSLYHRR
jgi:hypothetical protein